MVTTSKDYVKLAFGAVNLVQIHYGIEVIKGADALGARLSGWGAGMGILMVLINGNAVSTR